MRKPNYLRFRKFLKISKEILTVVLLILTIVLKLKGL